MATPTKTPAKPKAATKTQPEPAQAENVEQEGVTIEDDPIEKLAPISEKIWIIGKPPEMGGDENQWGRYIQRPMGYIEMQRFVGMITKYLGMAVREGGTAGFEDVLGGSGSLIERGRALRERDLTDAGSFMSLALSIASYVPDFFLECYCFWLDIPYRERDWAKLVMAQRWDPDNDSWGLKREDANEMTSIFISQNYEEIRAFFVEDLPGIGRQIVAQEQARNTESQSSKQ